MKNIELKAAQTALLADIDAAIGSLAALSLEGAKVAVRVHKLIPDGWKGRAQRVASAVKARYSHREGAYIMPPSKARKLLTYLADGWDANGFSDELYPPAAPLLFV